MALHLDRGSVDFDLEDLDLRQALAQLFLVAHIDYSLPPEVQGTVTIHLRHATYQQALQAMLGEAFTYSIDEHQVVHIHRAGTTWKPWGNAA